MRIELQVSAERETCVSLFHFWATSPRLHVIDNKLGPTALKTETELDLWLVVLDYEAVYS